MCDCNNNIVDLSHLKIYTVMAEYKAKQSSGTTYKGDFKIKWATATQDELAYAYEELGLTSLVEKISTTTKKNEAKKTDKKKSSKNKSKD
tara:strand:+ start:1479 stop:1748 length:270 start_codon:yes stop_codon:yes gene_type:complete